LIKINLKKHTNKKPFIFQKIKIKPEETPQKSIKNNLINNKHH